MEFVRCFGNCANALTWNEFHYGSFHCLYLAKLSMSCCLEIIDGGNYLVKVLNLSGSKPDHQLLEVAGVCQSRGQAHGAAGLQSAGAALLLPFIGIWPF